MNNYISPSGSSTKKSSSSNITPSSPSGIKRTSGNGQNLIGNNFIPQKSSHNAINNNMNNPTPLNNPIPSINNNNNNNINDINQNQIPSIYDDLYTKLPIILIIILSIILIILVIFYCSRKKWNKVGYYEDDDEGSRVVYIR